MLSVIIPTYNEEKYIALCIESIIHQDYPKDDLEVLFIDGMSVDRTREIIEQYCGKFLYMRMLDNPHRIVSCAMNKGINVARGNVVMRMDAHSIYEKNYITAIIKRLDELKVENVGCVCKTEVLNKTSKSLAIREVLCNRFGVGNSEFRIGVKGLKEVDTVPFGCWPKWVFEKYGLFNEKLVRNQDIEFCKRITKGGGKIMIIPDTYSTYFARETFSSLAKNSFTNGKWVVYTPFYTQNSILLSIRHIIPLTFLLGIIIPVCICLFWRPTLLISAIVLIAYSFFLSIASIKLSVKKSLNFLYLLWGFITLHVSYGMGSLIGLCSLPFLKK